MFVHKWWLVIISIVAVKASSIHGESLGLYHQNARAVPPSICSGDLSFTKGYRCEDYEVITKDGYILRLWRFREGRTKESRREGTKQPVFLQHGVFLDFWDFSYTEMGIYDLPASLNLVYAETGQKAHFIGHSQGTTSMFAAFSQWKVEERLKSAVMLAPVVYLSHMPFGVTYVYCHAYIGEIVQSFGISECNLMTPPLDTMLRAICSIVPLTCLEIIAQFSGPNCCFNSSNVELFLQSQLQPTSFKNLAHWEQGVRRTVFAHYDYGNPATNMEHYGVPEPPAFDLQKIPRHLPLYIIYGGKDLLAVPQDVFHLLNELRSHRNLRELYVDNYAHFDFIEGMNTKEIVYDDVVSFIEGIP
ncbi:triacylglycerol lipase 2 [Daucus carota subsp. sativus]|uniref:triacylglycerol lipase 2 n=1 Tax=Daucus carota subsp. sativus TaxID=79200 RepID=UPI003083477D